MINWVSECGSSGTAPKMAGMDPTEAMIHKEEPGIATEEESLQESCRRKVWPVAKTCLSVLFHLGFLASIAVVMWCFSVEQPRNRNIYISASLVAGLMYILILVEAAASDVYKSLRKFREKLAAADYIDKIKAARPQVRWQAECYHYEYTDEADMNVEHGSRPSRTHAKQRVVTGHDKETFHFTSWRDYTRDIKDLLRKPVIRFECSKVFIFKNESSKNQYMKQYQAFRERIRRRDEFMEHEEDLTIPGFQSSLTVCTLPCQKPCWLSDCVFWMCTLLLCTWPYRILFNRNSCQVYIVFVKQLEL